MQLTPWKIQRPKEVASELRWRSYIRTHTLETYVHNSRNEHMLSSLGSKNLKHTQPILCTHMGTYLIQSDWNAAASYVLSCPEGAGNQCDNIS